MEIAVVLPAFNAAQTLERTVMDIDRTHVSEMILVDDCSTDETVVVAHGLGLTVIEHEHNVGYGGNQKTCYRAALETARTSLSWCTRTISTTVASLG